MLKYNITLRRIYHMAFSQFSLLALSTEASRSIFTSLSHRFPLPLYFIWPHTKMSHNITMYVYVHGFVPNQTFTAFWLAFTATFWKTQIMLLKCTSPDLNMKHDILYLCEVSRSPKRETGSQYELTTSIVLTPKLKLRGLSPQANYTDRATAAVGEVVPTFAGRGCYVVSATDSHGR
jgi:hypothetical protein